MTVIPDKYQPYFWAKVQEAASGCWEWTGSKSEKGYGKFTFGYGAEKSCVRAHRAAFSILVGPIDSIVHLDHTCRNKSCVNPEHLRPVTNKQNQENRPGPQRNSTTGVRGVYLTRSGRPFVQVKHNQQLYREYGFDSIEEAAEAARRLRLRLFTHNDADREDAA